MSTGVAEVEPAATVVVIDLTLVVAPRVGPDREASLLHPCVHLVELALADEERVVLSCDVAVGIGEVEGHPVVHPDDVEVAERQRSRQAEDLGQERRRLVPVASADDGVVELDGHASDFTTT